MSETTPGGAEYGFTGPAVELTEVTCRGRSGPILINISLTVQEGEWLALFGPTACGKSAILRLLNGDIHPDTGSVAVLGEAPARTGVRIHHVPEEAPSPGRTSVRDALMAQLRGHRMPLAQRAARVAEALEVTGMETLRDVPERELTHGRRAVMALAAAIASDPRVLLLDNVTAALPEPVTARVFAYLDGRRAADGLTVIHATCSSPEAERADQVAMLDGGRLLVCEPPGRLIRRLAADRITIEADNPEEVQRTARGMFDVEIVEHPRGLRFSARDPVEIAAQVMRHPVGGASVVHVRHGTLWDAHARLVARTSNP